MATEKATEPAKKTKTRATRSKRKPRGCEQFMRVAGIQMRRACVPTAVSITVAVLISKIGSPIVPLALLGAGGWAWWRGYRVRLVRPEDQQNDSTED